MAGKYERRVKALMAEGLSRQAAVRRLREGLEARGQGPVTRVGATAPVPPASPRRRIVVSVARPEFSLDAVIDEVTAALRAAQERVRALEEGIAVDGGTPEHLRRLAVLRTLVESRLEDLDELLADRRRARGQKTSMSDPIRDFSARARAK